jgi:hypothetical protein
VTPTWTSCATPPTKDGLYWVQCCFADGEPLIEAEVIRFEQGRWIGCMGLEIVDYDKWRELDGGEVA